MIELKKVTIAFGSNVVLQDIDLRVDKGEIVTILGRSGCGKSTLLRAAMGLIPIASGEIFVQGRRVDDIKERDMDEVRKTMGMVFQEGALFDSMTVFENVAFALRRHTKLKEKEIREIVSERLEAVDLEDAEHKRPDQLSGGMRRRVGIARALAMKPDILLYDEPTTGLDPILTATVVELILKMRDRYGATSIVVTHDLEAASRISDRAAMIHEGRFIAQGAIAELEASADPDVSTFFTIMDRRAAAGNAKQGRRPDADA
jgi:phospholipid/cholesterol/gamma-HCH transport system ATP-binding protein